MADMTIWVHFNIDYHIIECYAFFCNQSLAFRYIQNSFENHLKLSAKKAAKVKHKSLSLWYTLQAVLLNLLLSNFCNWLQIGN